MRKSKFTEEQIAMALRQHEAGTTVSEICRKLEISDMTFFRWQKQFGGMGVTELPRSPCEGRSRCGRPPTAGRSP